MKRTIPLTLGSGNASSNTEKLSHRHLSVGTASDSKRLTGSRPQRGPGGKFAASNPEQVVGDELAT